MSEDASKLRPHLSIVVELVNLRFLLPGASWRSWRILYSLARNEHGVDLHIPLPWESNEVQGENGGTSQQLRRY